MNAQEFVLMQIEWLQAQYSQAQDADTRERLITAIEDIVIAALSDDVYAAK
jgi:hypothetical protein